MNLRNERPFGSHNLNFCKDGWKDSPHVVNGVRKEMERLTAAISSHL